MKVLAECIFTVAHQTASTLRQHRYGCASDSSGEIERPLTSECFRCSHHDPDL